MSDGAVGGCLSIYVVVSDVVRSVNFYQNLLALEFVVINWDDKGQDRGAFCELPDGVRLILSQESGRSAAVPQNNKKEGNKEKKKKKQYNRGFRKMFKKSERNAQVRNN